MLIIKLYTDIKSLLCDEIQLMHFAGTLREIILSKANSSSSTKEVYRYVNIVKIQII